MIIDGHKYTQEELDALTIHDLRIVLSKIGGVPKVKNRQVLIDEILQIQDGTLSPTRSNRGRKPKFIKIEAMERSMQQAENAEQGGMDGYSRPQYLGRSGGQSYGYGSDYSGNSQYNGNAQYTPASDYDRRNYGGQGSTVTVSDGQADKTVVAQGVLEIMESGYGFLRTYDCHFDYPDFYVDRQILRKYGLKNGDYVVGYAVNKFDKTSLNVREVVSINGIAVAEFRRGRYFDDYAAVYPDERLVLSHDTDDFALRAIDMVAPIGKGQRGLIVAPPKTGKTTLLKKLARAIETNYPGVYLIVLLIDERPEEVTDFADVVKKGEVVASTFDESPE